MNLSNNSCICWVTLAALDATSTVIYEWTYAFTSETKLTEKTTTNDQFLT